MVIKKYSNQLVTIRRWINQQVWFVEFFAVLDRSLSTMTRGVGGDNECGI